MFDIFKVVLMLSLIGAGLTIILLILKPITSKKISARWQYYIWFAVMIFMIFPVWKCVPSSEIQKIPIVQSPQNTSQIQKSEQPPQTEAVIIDNIPIEYREVPFLNSVRIYDFVAYVWVGGMGAYLILALGSYVVFLNKKKKTALTNTQNEIFDRVKLELHIRRNIPLVISNDNTAPMLVGIFKPIIYLPKREISDKKLRMIFLHELTHYKRSDLIFKWFSLFVNAVHWFNPLAYLASANINEACEISCDMEVTSKMNEDEQDLYMSTILDLVQQK